MIKQVDCSIKLMTATVDGKHIAFCSDTDFLVQVGKGSKGSYKTRYSFKGSLALAIFHYKALNIAKPFKKRLFVPSFNRPVVARYNPN